jgi:hypothetical protein
MCLALGVKYSKFYVLSVNFVNNVVYLLKARTVEPEEQLLLVNGSETAFVLRQCLSKHLPVAMDAHATIVVLLEMVFSTQSVQRGYKEDN